MDIPKNGNCLFTAVGFQLQQLFSIMQVPDAMKTHIENLGIKSELSLTEIAAVLRNLVLTSGH